MPSLVGSEMCIRDSPRTQGQGGKENNPGGPEGDSEDPQKGGQGSPHKTCRVQEVRLRFSPGDKHPFKMSTLQIRMDRGAPLQNRNPLTF
jgi:hypothetical protein